VHFELKLRRVPEKVWVGALIFLLLLIAIWLGLGWFSYFRVAASHPQEIADRSNVDLQTAINSITASHLFGQPRPPAAPPPPQIAAPPPLNVKLKGVFAATGVEPAYAILNMEGNSDQAVKMGDELQDGIMLTEVHPAHVVVKRGAVVEKIALEEKFAKTAPRTPSPQSLPSTLPLPRPAAQPKNGAAGPVPKAESTPAVVNPAAGLKIESVPSDSIAHKLGLKKGDVVTQINGQVVTSPDDLTRLYQQFSQVGQVILEGTRDGKPMKLSLN
jgi:type II secretion system protein C